MSTDDLSPEERVCTCSLRTRLVGDGCQVCNPELWAELLTCDWCKKPSAICTCDGGTGDNYV